MERGARHKAALKQTKPTRAHAGVGAAEMIHDLYAARRRNAKRKDPVHPHCARGGRGARAEKQILLELL